MCCRRWFGVANLDWSIVREGAPVPASSEPRTAKGFSGGAPPAAGSIAAADSAASIARRVDGCCDRVMDRSTEHDCDDAGAAQFPVVVFRSFPVVSVTRLLLYFSEV